MNSLEKWTILTPLQKLPNNEANLGKIIVAKGNLVTLVAYLLSTNGLMTLQPQRKYLGKGGLRY